jgi:hypothetical protein
VTAREWRALVKKIERKPVPECYLREFLAGLVFFYASFPELLWVADSPRLYLAVSVWLAGVGLNNEKQTDRTQFSGAGPA